MKRFSYLKAALATSCLFVSPACKDILEQPDDAVITADQVFSTPDNAMQSLYNVYATCQINGFITGDGSNGRSDAGTNDGLLLAASDEGDQVGTGGVANSFNDGTWGPSNQNEYSIQRVTQGMRNACVFLENVDKVPFISTGQYNWTPQLKAQTIAEAKVLRALMHFDMMSRFGGIPIISEVPKVVIKNVGGINKAEVTPSANRQSLKRTIAFIVRSCDEAIADLPNSYPSSDLGRLTKGAAMALKARTLLYAASPLYNTATPYLSFGADSLICMQSFDPQRWQDAVVANKAVLDWAASNGYALLDDATLGKSESYNYATGAVFDPKNKEILFFDHTHGQQAGGANIVRWACPIYFSWGNSVMALPMNFIQKTYRDRNGNDITLPTTGSFPAFKNLMRRMEPRFHATAWWPGSQYTNTGLMNTVGGNDTSKFLIKVGSASGTFQQVPTTGQLLGNGVPNGIHQKKFINLVNALNGRFDGYWPIFRLAEFYLNHAEALNEVNPADPAIFTSLNAIRTRAGLPLLAPGNATYASIAGSKDRIRAYIQRERAVELYGEEHRFFDVRRWKIAANDGVMKGDFFRIFLHENGTGSYVYPTPAMTPAQRLANDQKLSYRIEKFETRVWDDKMYFYPFPQAEVNKGFLVQNPGW
ncbi:RagB/SusD family nutrient uptake outer membrane protein [Hymenobacter armeniacus]|uniref:RagB/SusD family nutrient uptake outer membrane protein n=1 Tax=Hymenobacter armeniacus TaxID=2771358 RepID=A0ABR8JZ86_9BACT|nr:RagB/SusD family nutrient uptake outer membrane protein [Hymenobacter armeniacus]MBD2723114.1 RagB/SusD family nutrient uptake outer membrane protein [Hymenobacter armeniacus]